MAPPPPTPQPPLPNDDSHISLPPSLSLSTHPHYYPTEEGWVWRGGTKVFPSIVRNICGWESRRDRGIDRFLMNWVSPDQNVPGWDWNSSTAPPISVFDTDAGPLVCGVTCLQVPATSLHLPNTTTAPLPLPTFFSSWNKKPISGRIRAEEGILLYRLL